MAVLYHEHEITETQSLETLLRGLCHRGDRDCGVQEEKLLITERAAQQLTFLPKYESLASVGAAHLKQ